MKHTELLNLLASNNEVYFLNSFDGVAFKSIPDGGYEAKLKNGKPYAIEIGAEPLTQAFLEGNVITKEQYEKY
jgi:hypothetical protein